MTKSHSRRMSLDWPDFSSAQGDKALHRALLLSALMFLNIGFTALRRREVWLIKTCSSLVWFCHWNGYRNKASLAWFYSTNTWSDRYKTGWLYAQGVIQQARTTLFQVNNKVILSGISVFTLVIQGYINKNETYPFRVSFHLLLHSVF